MNSCLVSFGGNFERHGERESTLARRVSSNSREENAVALAPDLGVVDDGRRRVGDEPEAAYRSHGRNGNGNVSDLEEVPGELIRCVMDAQEALYDSAPLEVDRFDPPAHESQRAVLAEAVRNREGVEHTDVFRVEFGGPSRQVYVSAAFRQWSRPERKALRDAGIP